MSILTLGSKKEKKGGKEGNSQSKVGESKRKRRKFPIKSGRKQKEKKGNSQSKNGRKQKRKKKKERKLLIRDRRKNRRNVQRGLWTRPYLNSTELSPNEQKEGKETTT